MAYKARRRPSWKRNPIIKVPVKISLPPEVIKEITRGKNEPAT